VSKASLWLTYFSRKTKKLISELKIFEEHNPGRIFGRDRTYIGWREVILDKQLE
jgi:hypothetical protein